jgi:hypothetical protein
LLKTNKKQIPRSARDDIVGAFSSAYPIVGEISRDYDDADLDIEYTVSRPKSLPNRNNKILISSRRTLLQNSGENGMSLVVNGSAKQRAIARGTRTPTRSGRKLQPKNNLAR